MNVSLNSNECGRKSKALWGENRDAIQGATMGFIDPTGRWGGGGVEWWLFKRTAVDGGVRAGVQARSRFRSGNGNGGETKSCKFDSSLIKPSRSSAAAVANMTAAPQV